jgi:transcriptional regulator with XRE-family HTH domain
VSSPSGGKPETFSKRLRRLRVERGLTQRELAALTRTDEGEQVSHAHISRLETRGRNPTLAAVRILARALAVTPEYLERGLDMTETEALELRLNDAELCLRLGSDPPAAEAAMRAVRDAAERIGAVNLLARAEAGLGLACVSAGRQREAVVRLRRAVESPVFTPTARPDVFRTLILALMAGGEPAEAAALAQRCLDELDRLAPDDVAARVQYATYLSAAWTDMGDFDAAHDAIAGLEERIEAIDEYSQVRLHWAASRLAASEGNARLAIDEMEQAIVVLRKTEDSLQLARAHMVCAEILGWSDRPREALRHLAIFEQLLQRPDHPDIGEARSMQALCSAKTGDFDRAHEFAREALQLLGDTQTGQAAAWYALALALTQRGEAAGADDAFAHALPLLEDANSYAWASQVCRDWAAMLAEADEIDRALPLSMKADELRKHAARRLVTQHRDR